MSELGYWVEHFWDRKPIIITRVNKIHSSFINYTELEMDPSNNYKIETYKNRYSTPQNTEETTTG